MEELANDSGNEALAQWNYSQQEWRRYIIWSQRKKSIFHYLAHILNPFRKKRPPEIKITSQRIWIGDKHQPFSADDHELRKINIRDAGKFNLLEISCSSKQNQKNAWKEIRIPVPKGKLREAIDLQVRLDPSGRN